MTCSVCLQVTLLCQAACTPAPTCPWGTWILPRSPSTLSTTRIKVSRCHQQRSWRQVAEFSVHILSYPVIHEGKCRAFSFSEKTCSLLWNKAKPPARSGQHSADNFSLDSYFIFMLLYSTSSGCCTSAVGLHGRYIFLPSRHLNISHALLCLCVAVRCNALSLHLFPQFVVM